MLDRLKFVNSQCPPVDGPRAPSWALKRSAHRRAASRRRQLLTALVGAGTLVVSSALSLPFARADEEPAGDKPAYETMSLEELLQVPIVVTASREEESANEAPATTQVITREEIRLRGYSFLKDVLRDLPGMETQEYQYPRAGSTVVPVRGVVGNNKILILVNGVRVNPPGGEPLNLASNISVRDADQIEIVYGPGSTLYGQDAISAVINIITRQPGDENVPIRRRDARDRLLGFTPNNRRLFTAGVEVGYPLQKEVYGSLNVKFGKVRLYGSVHYLDKELTDLSQAYPEFWAQQEMVAAGRELPLDPKRFDQGLNAMFRLDYGDTSLQIWHAESARSSSEGFGGGYYVNDARWQDTSTVVEARNVLPLGRYFSLESILVFNYNQLAPISRTRFPGLAAMGQPPIWGGNNKYSRGVAGTLSERLTFKLQRRLTVVAGLFVGHYDVVPVSSVPQDVDLNSSIPAQGGTITYYTHKGDPSSLTTIAAVNQISYQDIGGYLEGNWHIFKPLRLIVGLRLDKNTTVSDLAFSPRAALIFNYQSFTAKYIFARAFVAPSPTAKFDVYRAGTVIHGATPDLLPETATSNELNFSFDHRHFNIGTSFYYNLQENLIFGSGLAANSAGTVWLDAAGLISRVLTRTVNTGSSTAMGVDFYGKFNIWKLSGWASYSFASLNVKVDDKDIKTYGYSQHNFRVGVSVSILKNLHVTGSAIVKSVPVNLVGTGALEGLIELPWELNAHVVFSPIPSLDLYADFRNLSNHKYYLLEAANNFGPYPIQAFQGSGGLRFTF